MVKILLELDKDEDRIVNLVKAIHNLEDKRIAIKKIIRLYGKKIKAKDENIG